MTTQEKPTDPPVEMPDIEETVETLKTGTKDTLEVYLRLLVDTVDEQGDSDGQAFMLSPMEAFNLSEACYYVFDPDEHILRKYPLPVSTDIEETMVQSFCSALYTMGRQLIQTAQMKGLSKVRIACVNADRIISEGLRWHGMCNPTVKPYMLYVTDMMNIVFKHTPLSSEELQSMTQEFFEDAFDMTDLQLWLRVVVKVDPSQIPAV